MKNSTFILVEKVLVQEHLLGNLQELESAVNAAVIQIKVIYDPKNFPPASFASISLISRIKFMIEGRKSSKIAHNYRDKQLNREDFHLSFCHE